LGRWGAAPERGLSEITGKCDLERDLDLDVDLDVDGEERERDRLRADEVGRV
jgi:hypothetical protein